MSNVDPVVVATRIVTEATSFPYLWDSTSETQTLALCRVVIAAAEVIASVPSTYDETHPTVQRHAAALIALAAALKGER